MKKVWRLARKSWWCTNPTGYVWCLRRVKAGERYCAVVDAEGSRVAVLCRECEPRSVVW